MARRIALVLVVGLLGVAASAARLPATERYRAADTYEDRYYLPAPEWLTVFSLGYREALADLVWLRLVVYYGEELAHRGDEVHVFQYAEAILGLDPDSVAVYRWIATLGIYRANGATPEQIERAIGIMERGVARRPDDGDLAWRTGAALAFELAPLLGDRREEQARVRERAIPYLLRAAQLGAAPPYAMLTNAALLERIGRSEQAVTHLEEMYAVTSDLALRAEIASHIQELRSASFAAGLEEENTRFEDAWGREMPYAPAALYDLVGPVPVLDTRAVMREGFGAHALDDEPALP